MSATIFAFPYPGVRLTKSRRRSFFIIPSTDFISRKSSTQASFESKYEPPLIAWSTAIKATGMRGFELEIIFGNDVCFNNVVQLSATAVQQSKKAEIETGVTKPSGGTVVFFIEILDIFRAANFDSRLSKIILCSMVCTMWSGSKVRTRTN